MGEIVAIVSGKGGVGKTTLCAFLATALALQDKKVVCIDCDTGLNNLDIALGLEEKTIFDLSDVLSERTPLHKALVTHNRYRNLSMIPAAADFRAHIEEKKLRELCKKLAQSCDYVLLDCPAGLGEGFASAVYAADRALVVATPDITAIRDAGRAAALIVGMHPIPVQLIINRMRPAFVKKGYFENVDNIMDEIGLPLLGIIPEDEKVMVCANTRRSIFEEKKASAADALVRIAWRLCGKQMPLSPLWRKKKF
ncbi:MAG: septum site-determining protein MinD [Clostridia bacterium]|nr:septum site-determining protein MinD [Clostridia bacterium]